MTEVNEVSEVKKVINERLGIKHFNIDDLIADSMKSKDGLYTGMKFGQKLAVMATLYSGRGYPQYKVDVIRNVLSNPDNLIRNLTKEKLDLYFDAEYILVVGDIMEKKLEDKHIDCLAEGFEFIVKNHHSITKVIPDYINGLKKYYSRLNKYKRNGKLLFDLSRFD